MQRRDVPKVLFASAAHTALPPRAAQPGNCTNPCFAQTPAEVSAGITPLRYEHPPGEVLRYGADPSGAADSTAAFNNALRGNSHALAAHAGTYRIDGTIVVDNQQELHMWQGVTLQRQSGRTSATTPLIHLKGLYAVCRGGLLETQNDAPGGVVCCGHLDITTSGWNAFWWHLADCDINCKDYLGNTQSVPIANVTRADPAVVSTVPHEHGYANGQLVLIAGVTGMEELNQNVYCVAAATPTSFELAGNGSASAGEGRVDSRQFVAYSGEGHVRAYPYEAQCIGVYVPSSQPVLGNRCANFYGKITNVHVQSATSAFWLTDIANAHQLANINWNGFYWNGLVLQGAYGNRAILGFCDGAYSNGVIGIYLRERGRPRAPHASSLGASRNHVMGGTFEFGTTGNIGCCVSQDGRCTNNFIEFAFNTRGTILQDAAAGNTVLETKMPLMCPGLTLTAATATGAGSNVSLGTSTTDSANSGSAAALPARPAGYWTIDIGGSKRKIPFYLP